MRFMRTLPALGAAGAALLWAGAAFAEMTGHYVGYGEGAGTTLDLQQAGDELNGRISGVVTGALLGTTDGGDNATGVVLLFGVAKLPFAGVLQNGDLQLTITGVNGELTLVPFRLDAAPAPVPAQPTKPRPAPAPSPLPPAPDLATATAALRVVLGEIIAAEFGDAAADVRTTLMDCLLTAVAPLSAGEIQLLADLGFQPDDATIAQLERTAPGIDDVVTGCFAAADTPPSLVSVPAPTPAPGPAPTKPGPVPAPQPPAPVTLDDATVDANLRTVLAGVVAGELPDANVEHQTAVVECLMTAVAGLSTAERQHLADIGFDPDEADVARLETLVPGITEAVGTCFGGEEPARTSVTLPNGAAAIIEGGTDHVFEPIEGGYRISVGDALDIIVTATDLTVSGTTVPLPATFAEIRVVIGDDGFAATVDGAPLAID